MKFVNIHRSLNVKKSLFKPGATTSATLRQYIQAVHMNDATASLQSLQSTGLELKIDVRASDDQTSQDKTALRLRS